MLGKRITPSNVVEHLLHDNRFHVLFPSHDGRSIGEDCRDVQSRSSEALGR